MLSWGEAVPEELQSGCLWWETGFCLVVAEKFMVMGEALLCHLLAEGAQDTLQMGWPWWEAGFQLVAAKRSMVEVLLCHFWAEVAPEDSQVW